MTDMTHDVIDTVAAGGALTDAQVEWLLETRDLVQLGMVGADARARRVGTSGTFVRVDTVPLAQAATWDVAPEAGEARIVGAPASLDEAVAAIDALRARSTVPVSGFAMHDLALAAGADLGEWCKTLRAAGLSAVASARADRLDDEWLSGVTAAGLTILSVAPGWPAGGRDLLAVLQQVREWQARHGAFIAWQPLALEVPETDPSTGYDDMRAVVSGRVLLDNVAHIQVDWTRTGAKLAQACLLFGADDLDNVPARDDMPHGPRRSILEEVRRNITAAGLTPVERTTRFEARTSSPAPGIDA